jgi:uncharacterized membrane-anchored protein YjiN (DUF445 family)
LTDSADSPSSAGTDSTGTGTGTGASASARPDVKAEQLRRVQLFATVLLGAMLLLLVLSAACQNNHPWLEWLRALAEGGAVGAMADWYAVTALFRQPFGLPIPHTAIIPSNKDRIGAALGDFVEQNFLTPANIIAKLQEHDAAAALAQWLAVPQNSLRLASTIAASIPGMLRGLRDSEVQQFVDRALTPLLSPKVSELAGHVLAVLTQDGRHQALLDRALRALEHWLVSRQALITAKFSQASRFTPPLLDRYVVSKFMQGIVALLHDIAGNPRHELRLRLDAAVRKLIDDLRSSEEYRQKGVELLRAVVEHCGREDYYRALWQDVQKRIDADLASESPISTQYLADALIALGDSLMKDPGVRRKLNAWWLDAVHRVGTRYRREISGLITDVVNSWDAEEVSRKLELEIGKDLQYIRINGTVVGGAVGLLLHGGVQAIGSLSFL